VPTTTNWVLVSSIQTIFIVIGVYLLAIFNLIISRIHKLKPWKVAVAQAAGLAVLFVVGGLVYRLAHVIATRFKDLASAVAG
jgi:heme/copper-type cytochrome/quinol oxidase subunit 1